MEQSTVIGNPKVLLRYFKQVIYLTKKGELTMERVQTKKREIYRGLGLFLAVFMLVTSILPLAGGGTGSVQAAPAAAITSMAYFSPNDGPVLNVSGVGEASFGFVAPVFNGGANTWAEVVEDLQINVLVNGVWTDIDTLSQYVYNSNWGNWQDAGFNGYWFVVSDTTELQLVSRTNPSVSLTYELNFTNLGVLEITSMTATQGPQIAAGITGGAGFTYPSFNGDPGITYAQVADDLKIFVWSDENEEWLDIDNAATGFVYDQNWGQFWDGGGGLWFTVERTTRVRLASKTSPNVVLDYTIVFNEPVRTDYVLSADVTTYVAGDNGAIGVPLPMIDGDYPRASELGNFVYQKLVNGNWVALDDFAASGFSYQANGYNSLSASDQWGYWTDHIYGLWFQPIQENMQIRIGYPTDGEPGGPVGNNYIVYQFTGNPNAPRPDVSDLGNIELGTDLDADIDGWDMIWNDEFDGNNLNKSKWGYDAGYYLNDDPSTWGWGNAELEYYTESTDNIFVEDGKLNLRALDDPTTFPQDPNRVAPYSSGKVVSRDLFSFKYGRIDFSAKLPAGDALWPALWLLPADDAYGTWAASGEIDVMEARGRLPGASSGALHFGGQWPANTHIGGDYAFENGERFDTDFHTYSLVWEEDNIKWYVDGNCFYKATNEQWYSLGANNNENAPFDQEFFIIMNLAVGGWFDGGIVPDPDIFPTTMQVDYVRVYQAEGSNNGTYTDNGGSGSEEPEEVLLSAGRPVTASGSENVVFGPECLTDSNLGSRWSSNFDDSAWFVMDLERECRISKMVLTWEPAYGKKYELYVSQDGINYTRVFTQNDGQGGTETIELTPVNARYVKFQGVERALPYGYSLWEAEVFGTEG